jgi:antitoxin component YwqK of YwqJK toxin-antitoxin module
MERGEKNTVPVDDLEMINGYICLSRTGELFTGTYYSRHANGVIGEEVEVEEGRRHGVVKMYNEEGQQIVEAHFFRGNKHGMLTMWYDNGVKRSEVNMQWGMREGVMKVWYEDGSLKIRGYYKEDRLHGTQKKYFPNGRLRLQVDFREDVEHGFKTIWDEEGNILFEGRYIDGEREG